MTKVIPIALAAGALALAGCATTDDTVASTGTGACRQDAGQSFVGQLASAETGEELLKATKAKQLRWAPPRSAMTMDLRPDRLTVSYDDSMKIVRVACG